MSGNRLECTQNPHPSQNAQDDYQNGDDIDCKAEPDINMKNLEERFLWQWKRGGGIFLAKGSSLYAEDENTKLIVSNNVAGLAGGIGITDRPGVIHVTKGAEIEISGNKVFSDIGGAGIMLYNKAMVILQYCLHLVIVLTLYKFIFVSLMRILIFFLPLSSFTGNFRFSKPVF